MNYTVADAANLLGAKMKRFVEFDILRGILLLMMSVDHSPSSLRRFTDQPLGFFTTAECFVFVSAFLAGMRLSQTRRKARVRRRSLLFDSPGRTHLPGTSRHSFLRICSWQLLLIRASWHQKYVRPLSDGSMGGDWWVTGAAFPAALDGHPPDVRPILLSHTCRFRGSSTMGMEDGPFCQLFGVDHRTDRCQGHIAKCIQRSVRSSNSVRSIFSHGSFYGSAGCSSVSVFWKTEPCCRRLICYDRS